MTYAQGYRAALEAAAKWHDDKAAGFQKDRDNYLATTKKLNAHPSYLDHAVTAENIMVRHQCSAAAIRALPVPTELEKP